MRLMPCKQTGCAANVEGGGYCAKHHRDNDRTRDPANARYRSRAWRSDRSGIALAVRTRNPICQKLHCENGRLVRCHNASRLVHHVTGARLRPDLFLSVYDETGKSNLIALCQGCHPSAEETNAWQEAAEGSLVPAGKGNAEFFVRTEWRIWI